MHAIRYRFLVTGDVTQIFDQAGNIIGHYYSSGWEQSVIITRLALTSKWHLLMGRPFLEFLDSGEGDSGQRDCEQRVYCCK